MFRTIVLLTLLSPAPAALAVESSFEMAEQVQVTREACGPNPTLNCLAELRKVCHAHPTFRCYYSRMERLDAIRQVGFPEEHARVHDE